LQHVEGLHKRPAARFKHITFVAARAFQINYAVALCSFFTHF
jgi:hypothetical protein